MVLSKQALAVRHCTTLQNGHTVFGSVFARTANAGGLGGCGALLMQPDAIHKWVSDVRAGTNGGFQVNLWMPDPPMASACPASLAIAVAIHPSRSNSTSTTCCIQRRHLRIRAMWSPTLT
jgi:hypothetical protein